MKLKSLQIWPLEVPFRFQFRHGAAQRSRSTSVIARVETDTGGVGWGETIAREELTGETQASVVTDLKERYWPGLERLELSATSLQQWRQQAFARADAERRLASFCAIDLALDHLEQNLWPRNLDRKLRKTSPPQVATIGLGKLGPWSYALFSVIGYQHFKLKAVSEADVAWLRGWPAWQRRPKHYALDFNGMAELAGVQKFLAATADLPWDYLEQPTPDPLQWSELRAAGAKVWADESLCSLADAKRLADLKAIDGANLRLAKNGGITGVRNHLEFAKTQGWQAKLGCLVGETQLLQAAGQGLQRGSEFVGREAGFSRLLLAYQPIKAAYASRLEVHGSVSPRAVGANQAVSLPPG